MRPNTNRRSGLLWRASVAVTSIAAVALLAVWVLSFHWGWYLSWTTTRWRLYFLSELENGGVEIGYAEEFKLDAPAQFGPFVNPQDSVGQLENLEGEPIHKCCGFWWGRGTIYKSEPKWTCPWRAVRIPLYAPTAACLAAALFLRVDFGRRRWRRAHGRCERCGYDLRASRSRCPECGTLGTETGSGTDSDQNGT